MPEIVITIFLTGVLILASMTDIRLRRIPNALTFPTVMIAFFHHFKVAGGEGLFISLAGMLLGISLFIIPYLMGGMGAGDVKLLGAVGAVLGPKGVFMAALFTAVIGSIYAMGVLLCKYKQNRGLLVRYAMILKLFAGTGQIIPIPASENEAKTKLCYGIAISVGTLVYIYMERTGVLQTFLNW